MSLFEGIPTEDFRGNVGNYTQVMQEKNKYFVVFLQIFCTFEIISE